MKVELAVLHAGMKHLFPFLLSRCKNQTGKKKTERYSTSPLLVLYGMMLVKANILNDKESGNSKKRQRKVGQLVPREHFARRDSSSKCHMHQH